MVQFHAIDEPISPSSLHSRKRRMGEALILEGSADAPVFELSIEQILAPSLQAGQIVILDNLSTHLGEKVRQASRAHGVANSCFSHPILPTFRRLRKHSRSAIRLFTPSRSAHSRGIAGSNWASAAYDHQARCSWLVYALRLSRKHKPTARLGKIEHVAKHACKRATAGNMFNWGLSQPRKNSCNTGARTSPARLWVWPSRARSCA